MIAHPSIQHVLRHWKFGLFLLGVIGACCAYLWFGEHIHHPTRGRL